MKTLHWRKEVEINFDEANHMYVVGDMPVPGVTTILKVIDKPALIQWAAGMASDHWLAQLKERCGVIDTKEALAIHKAAKVAHRTFSRAAADIGSNVHAYAEASLKGLPAPDLLTDQAKKGAEAFEEWKQAHTIKLGASERIIFSKEHWYAGTCDFVGWIDDEPCVADFKTSSGVYPEMRFQLAAYQHALEEEFSKPMTARYVIRFDKKTGAFEAVKCFDHQRDFEQGFLPALTLHRTLKRIEQDNA